MVGYTVIEKGSVNFDKLATQKISIVGESVSPFKEGKIFTVDKRGYRFQNSDDGKKTAVVIIINDANGKECDLWATTMLKVGTTNKNERIENNSALAKIVKDIVNPDITNKEFAEAIIKAINNRPLICTRIPYVKEITTARGTSFAVPASLVGFEFGEPAPKKSNNSKK